MVPTHILRERDLAQVQLLLDTFPVTAILGPRQSGKTTLARSFRPEYVFDLENPRDVATLAQPQLALEGLRGLIMIDEVQRMPSLFPLLRYLVDQHPEQRYLLLGSASSNLRQQSGESLAGRIGYHYLSGLHLSEIGIDNLWSLWLRGGFPRSFLAAGEKQSMIWRQNFITTFLERDLAMLGLTIPASEMFRFWLLTSHYHGQTMNYSELGRAFGISDKTVKQYLTLLEDTFMIRLLPPWYANVSKRIVKSPKLYLRDSGIFHALQSIPSMDALRSNPKIGASWEGFALEELVSILDKRDNELFFYGTHGGVELDLFWQQNGCNLGAEFKYVDAPKVTKSMRLALDDLQLDQLYVIYPGDKTYALSDHITALPLASISSLKV